MKGQPRIILAFDFGLKHIGLAVGQEVSNTANTFYSLKAVAGKPDWHKLDEIIQDWKPVLFVVGNPINMDGTDSKIKEKSDGFSKFINKRYNIPVQLMDERLTSREAKERMELGSDYSVEKKTDIHEMSAKIILESWFREQS